MGWPYQQKPLMGWPLDYDSGLVPEAGAWFMLEGSGNKVFDLSGNGYHLTAGGDPTWVAGKFGSATHYVAASNQYFSRDCSPVTSMPYTVVCWVKAGEDNPAAVRYFFYFGQSGDSADWFTFSFGTDGKVRAWERTLPMDVYSLGDIADGQYHQIVSTVEVTTSPLIKIYVDSVFQNFELKVASDETSTYDRVAIGMLRDQTPSGGFQGDIDHVLMYNRALSASEIAKLYRKPFCMFKDPAEIALLGGYQVVSGIPILRRRREGA